MRITPEQVVEAYKTTGLKPMQGAYFPEPGCACGLGVIAKNAGRDQSNTPSYINGLVGVDYRCGFASGFDGELSDPEQEGDTDRYVDGYADGQAAWLACVDAGLVEVTSDAGD